METVSYAVGQVPLVLLSLKYTYLVKPGFSNVNNAKIYFETSTVPWKKSFLDEVSFAANGDRQQSFIIDNIASIRSVVNGLNNSLDNKLSTSIIEPISGKDNITAVIQGPASVVNEARGKILRSYNQVIYKSLTSNGSKIVNQNNTVNTEISHTLSEIASYYNVEIIISNFKTDFKHNSPVTVQNDSDVNIYIIGNQDNVSLAEARVRVSLDDFHDLCVDSLGVELCTLPLIGGTNFANFKNIAKLSGANLHLPDILPELFNSKISASTSDSSIFITGTRTQVLSCKSILKEIISGLKFYVKNCVITRVKNDFLCLVKQADIVNIMFKYGVYIQLPSMGDFSSVVVVQGNSPNSVELAIGDLMILVSKIYNIDYRFELENGTQVQSDLILPFLTKIANKKLVTITYLNNCFEINGIDKDAINALSYLSKLPSNDMKIKTEKFVIKLELSNTQKDFIGGKKNGKLLRIMNQTNILIKYQAFNEHNFFIDIVSDKLNDIIAGFELIENELPFEYTFNIPEAFHRQVIGSGGQTIQTIMRKYNVFIKFSNTYDLAPNFLSFVRYDNVIIRCPFKNAKNIPLVEKELLELVNNCSEVLLTTYFMLLKSHYKILIKLNAQKNFLNNIEKTTSTFIKFPEEAIGNHEMIEIKGSDTQSDQAAKLLKSHLPQVFEFKIANASNFGDIINENKENFMNEIVLPFSIGLKIEIDILANERNVNENSTHHKILLSYSKEQTNELEIAIEELTRFLRSNDFLIIDKGRYKFEPIMTGSAGSISAASSPSKYNRFNKQNLQNHHSGSNYLQPIPLQSIYNSSNIYANNQHYGHKSNKPSQNNINYIHHSPKHMNANANLNINHSNNMATSVSMNSQNIFLNQIPQLNPSNDTGSNANPFHYNSLPQYNINGNENFYSL